MQDGSDTDLAHWKAGDADAAWDPPEMPQLDHQLAWMQVIQCADQPSQVSPVFVAPWSSVQVLYDLKIQHAAQP